jgi:predicted RNA-binding Zn-ribbon protein involved in translation (DUF1610 family)
MKIPSTTEVVARLKAGERPPMSAMRVLGATTLLAEEGNGKDAKSIKVNIKARQRGPIDHPYWGKVYHDLGSMRSKKKVAIDDTHGTEIGYGYPRQSEYGLEVDGVVIPNDKDPTHDSNRIAYNLQNGIPQEGSIDFSGDYDVMEIPEGMSVPVNGQKADGPCLVVQNWPLRAVAICKEGADDSTETTEASLAATLAQPPKNILSLAVTTPPQPPEKEIEEMSDTPTKLTVYCESCSKEVEPPEKTDGDGDGFECPNCKASIHRETGKKMSQPKISGEAPPAVDPTLSVNAEAHKLAVDAAAEFQKKLNAAMSDLEKEQQKSAELQSRLDKMGNAGAPPIPQAGKPGEGGAANWEEAFEQCRKENPGKTYGQILGITSKKFPKLQASRIHHYKDGKAK